MARIELDHVTKVYPGAPPAVNDLTLDIPDGSFMVLVGPSGSGKSTALRMVAGLEDVTEGEIRIGGRVVNDVPAKDRDIAMVFQNYALYPHMNVYENMSFGLKLKKTPKQVIDQRVRAAAGILDITELLDRKRWRTRVELANEIFEYLEIFHNRQRRHSALGWRTPVEFEKLHASDVA